MGNILQTLEESGWEPSEELLKLVSQLGLEPIETWKKFHWYWTIGAGDGKKKKDWRRTFLNWAKTEAGPTVKKQEVSGPIRLGGIEYNFMDMLRFREDIRHGREEYITKDEWKAIKRYVEKNGETRLSELVAALRRREGL